MDKVIKIKETEDKKTEKVYLDFKLSTITQGKSTLTSKDLLNKFFDKNIVSVNCIGHSVLEGCSRLELQKYDNGYYLGNEEKPYIILLKAKSTDITSCEINENTKLIYSDAFKDCSSLTSIVIPKHIINLSKHIFRDCVNINKATIPAKAIPFIPKDNLKKVVISSGRIIPSSAFEHCINLMSITIPTSVKKIGYSAFSYCYKLVEIYNLSSLEITMGSDSNGSIGKYAKVIHTSLQE